MVRLDEAQWTGLGRGGTKMLAGAAVGCAVARLDVDLACTIAKFPDPRTTFIKSVLALSTFSRLIETHTGWVFPFFL